MTTMTVQSSALIDRLALLTHADKLSWDYDPRDEAIRTNLSRGLVRIERDYGQYDGEQNGQKGYLIWVNAGTGSDLAGTISISRGEKNYAQIEELYRFVTKDLPQQQTGKAVERILVELDHLDGQK